MEKLNQVKENIQKTLARTSGPAGLFFSGGSDSLLLLHVLIDLKAKFSVVCFDHTFTREQKRQVDEWVDEYGLIVFSYAPSNAYLMGDGKKVSLVEEYINVLGGTVPFVRDVVHADGRCAVEDVKLGPFHHGAAPIGFTLNIFGTRKSDRHCITGRPWKTPFWSNGAFKYLAPLWGWTRKDVKAGLDHYNVKWPKLDTGSVPMCLNCLCGTGKVHCPKKNVEIDAIDWDPKGMADLFRAKYEFN